MVEYKEVECSYLNQQDLRDRQDKAEKKGWEIPQLSSGLKATVIRGDGGVKQIVCPYAQETRRISYTCDDNEEYTFCKVITRGTEENRFMFPEGTCQLRYEEHPFEER